MIDAEIRAILVCPICRGELVDVPRGLTCPSDGLTFPVVDGVPHLVQELALPATDAERAACTSDAK